MNLKAFEGALSEAVAGGKIAGAVALITDRQGATYEHVAGVRAAGQPASMDAGTLFWIASMTKAVVSVGALRLVEQGKLSLDADLGDLLPDLKNLEVLDGVVDGKPHLRPAKGYVTLRQLLSHTSGFAYSFTDPKFLAYSQIPGVLDPNSGTRAAHRQPLMFDPGQGFIYGIGIDWAGLAIEAASGQRLDAYLSEALFGPLGMTDTGFRLTPAQMARKASVHVRSPDGSLIPTPLAPQAEAEVLSGGGGLYSTARDYGRFLRMLMSGDGQGVISASTLAGLSQSQSGPHRAGFIDSTIAALSNDFDPYPDMGVGHGLATMVTPQPTGDGRGAGALAWAGLANTYYWADPAAGLGGVLMTQLLPFADPTVLDLFRALERGAYGVA